jgi:hypothetical protein
MKLIPTNFARCMMDSPVAWECWSKKVMNSGRIVVLAWFLSTSCAIAQTAVPNDSIADSVGINIHLSFSTTLYYTNFPLILSSLKSLGIRHVRDGLIDWGTGSSFYYTNHQALAANGIKCDFITSINQTSQLISAYPARVGDMEAVEAPNEFDNSGTANWASVLDAYLPVIASGKTPGVSVIGPSLVDSNWWEANNSYEQVGNVSSNFQYANLHNYMAGWNPGTPGWTPQGYAGIVWSLSNTTTTWPGVPVMTTETGYNTDPTQTQPVPESVAAIYLPRLFLEQFLYGIKRTYLYELADDTYSGGAFGLMRADGSLKPGYAAVQNLIALTSDPGATFQPGSLPFTLSGNTANLASMLTEDRTGAFYLFLWVELPRYNVNTQQAIVVPAQNVNVQLPTSSSVAFINQWQADGAVTSSASAGGNPVALSVDDRLMVLKVIQSSTAPAPPTVLKTSVQ